MSDPTAQPAAVDKATWQVHEGEDYIVILSDDHDTTDNPIAEVFEREYADRIVRSVNQAAGMEALIDVAEMLTGDNIKGTEIPAQRTERINRAIDLARAALAAVEQLKGEA